MARNRGDMHTFKVPHTVVRTIVLPARRVVPFDAQPIAFDTLDGTDKANCAKVTVERQTFAGVELGGHGRCRRVKSRRARGSVGALIEMGLQQGSRHGLARAHGRPPRSTAQATSTYSYRSYPTPCPYSTSTPCSTAVMSLDPPTYILSLQNNIRARPISWEGAVRAKTITDTDLKKIKSIDKVRKEQRKQTIESDTDSFVALLLGGDDAQDIFQAAAKGKRQDIIQYMLVLTGDLIDGVCQTSTPAL